MSTTVEPTSGTELPTPVPPPPDAGAAPQTAMAEAVAVSPISEDALGAESPEGISAGSPSSPTRRRRGRRPAGADTRAQILASARRLFGERGYDAVSLRSIARDADVDPALVHHYFEGKPAVFAASCATAQLNPAGRLAMLAETPRGELGTAIARVFIEFWDDPEQQSAVKAIIQTATSPDEGIRPFREFLVSEVLNKLPFPDGEGRLDPRRSNLVASQLLGLAMTRHVLQLPAVAAASADELVRWVAPTLQRYIDEPLD